MENMLICNLFYTGDNSTVVDIKHLSSCDANVVWFSCDFLIYLLGIQISFSVF